VLNFYGLKLTTRQPVYVQIATHVKLQILRGNATSGDRLPSRREVAAQLQVNPNTVQKAFRLMEDEGYVRTSSTLGSVIEVDEAMLDRIRTEMTQELVSEFVASARELGLSFKQVIDLISELWE
jgi:DNA-binding transcriptional regulator YhcF (GntR family)